VRDRRGRPLQIRYLEDHKKKAMGDLSAVSGHGVEDNGCLASLGAVMIPGKKSTGREERGGISEGDRLCDL